MIDNKKIHQVLEYICSKENKSSFETDEIADNLGFSLSETNILAREIIKNGDAKDCGDNDTSYKGAVCLLKIVATKDAYNTGKYYQPEERFNVFIKTVSRSYNLLDTPESKVSIIKNAYINGKDTFTLSGEKFWISNLLTIKIYTYEKQVNFDEFEEYCKSKNLWINSRINSHYSPEALALLGEDVTDEVIGNSEFGEAKKNNENKDNKFVDETRLDELRSINNANYDLTKLIRLCEELNDNYSRENYLSVGMIGRTIIDHVPPVLNFSSFSEVANNYSGKSFKKSMQHLNKSLRNIADSYLHQQIRNKETLPNATQVSFQQDMDRSLEEIIRILK
jgi:hypothetical protein